MSDIKKIKTLLEYDASRQYFGAFTPSALSRAYGQLKRAANWAEPLDVVPVQVGVINGDVICNSIWYQMSYNPVRFGNISPFWYNNRNNIYRFCTGKIPPTTNDAAARDIIAEIRHHLTEYMTLNRGNNGQWRDVITTQNGNVMISLINGCSNPEYKMLAHLRDCIKPVASRNISDLKSARGPYRSEIIRIAETRHPELGPVMAVGQHMDDTECMVEEDRLDKMQENLQIILDNARYYDPELVQQVREEYQWVIDQQQQNTR